jgi:hypothetical protein
MNQQQCDGKIFWMQRSAILPAFNVSVSFFQSWPARAPTSRKTASAYQFESVPSHSVEAFDRLDLDLFSAISQTNTITFSPW